MIRKHANPVEGIDALLRDFNLTVTVEHLVPRLIEAGCSAALPILAEILALEHEARHQRRVTRLRGAAKLPAGKTFATFDPQRLPPAVLRKLDDLKTGDFLDEAVCVLGFGLPGVGKSHALAALGHALIEQGRSVLWTSTYALIQDLLTAKRDLQLTQKLRKLDGFELVILDDIGYVKQSPEEAEVLFTLLAERYERRSTALTSNLVFSDWERIFGNKMATSAAIDRLVHHSVVLEFDVPSYRTEKAKSRKQG